MRIASISDRLGGAAYLKLDMALQLLRRLQHTESPGSYDPGALCHSHLST